MSAKNILQSLCICLACAGFLGACASADPQPAEPEGVQDITPGQQSIIQPPGSGGQSGPVIEEKNI